MLSETIEVVTQVAMLVFVVGSIAAMELLGLTVGADRPAAARRRRLVVALLGVSAVVVPAAAIVAAHSADGAAAALRQFVTHRVRGRSAVLPSSLSWQNQILRSPSARWSS